MLLREARWGLIRFEEDDDLEALTDAIAMLTDIRDAISPESEDTTPVVVPDRN
jgi:hypothetical protein